MKTATAYRAEFWEIICPYCGHAHYLSIVLWATIERASNGMQCEGCLRTFLVDR